MSWWQFLAAVDGFTHANTADENDHLSQAEIDDLWALMQEA